jgi:hypothetical protein
MFESLRSQLSELFAAVDVAQVGFPTAPKPALTPIRRGPRVVDAVHGLVPK